MDEQLMACFRRVFPELRDDEIRLATMRQLGAWDSAALLQLIAAIEKTFALRFAPRHLETFTSFREIQLLVGQLVRERPERAS